MRNLMRMVKAFCATSLGHWKVRRKCEPVVRGLRVGQAMEEVLWLHISQGSVSTLFFSCPSSIQNLPDSHMSSFHSCAHTTVGVLFHDSILHLVTHSCGQHCPRDKEITSKHQAPDPLSGFISYPHLFVRLCIICPPPWSSNT